MTVHFAAGFVCSLWTLLFCWVIVVAGGFLGFLCFFPFSLFPSVKQYCFHRTWQFDALGWAIFTRFYKQYNWNGRRYFTAALNKRIETSQSTDDQRIVSRAIQKSGTVIIHWRSCMQVMTSRCHFLQYDPLVSTLQTVFGGSYLFFFLILLSRSLLQTISKAYQKIEADISTSS